MADAPDPEGPYLHLFHPHLLAQAHTDAARTASAHQVWCVICGGASTIEAACAPAARTLGERCADRRPGGDLDPPAPQRQHTDAHGPRQEVSGLVAVIAATPARGLMRLQVGGVVVFASHASGLAEALHAAAGHGDHVRVRVQRVGGDLYVRAISAP